MPTVSINTQFPGYELLGELGRGNARVVKARHEATGDLVAIKQFALNTHPDTLRRFQQESEIMTEINHPNVVKVREVHLDATMPYVVMEFVEGGDLRGLLKDKGSLDVPATIRLGLQIAEAFRAIHSRGIIHRDIKPENILYRRLISGELHFLLTDFGIAKILEDETSRTRTGQSLLTYEYAAPEQFDDPRNVDVAADYYALGAVLYECLAGHVPFALGEGAGLATFMRQVLTATPPPLALPENRYLPPTLDNLVQKLLAKKGEERVRNVDELELMLEQAKVEGLKAARMPLSPESAALPPLAPDRPATLAGPVYAAGPTPPTPYEAPRTDDLYEPEDSGLSSDRKMNLQIILTAVAVVLLLITLTMLMLNRNNGSDSDKEETQVPNEQILSPDSVYTRPAEESSYTGGDTTATHDTIFLPAEVNKQATPVEVKKDSTVSPTDSAATAKPDSTR